MEKKIFRFPGQVVFDDRIALDHMPAEEGGFC